MEDYNKKAEPSKIWGYYENGKNYKSSENLYRIIARNEQFYSGDQWKGVDSKGLPTPVFNFLEQLVDVKVSTLMANQLTIHRREDELSEEGSRAYEAAKAFNLMDKKNWERVKMDTLNEEMLLDAALSGLGISYWYWDNDIEYGNDFKTKGDFICELIDSVNLYVSNPNEKDIQKQDWIIIDFRKTVAQVKDMARKYGVPEEEIEQIKGDEDYVWQAYDKAQNEQDGVKDSSTNTTILLKLYKNKKTGTIWACKTTKEITIQDNYDTELTRYPVAIMPWKIRKRFIYGTAELTYIIANQQHVNKMEAMRQLHAQLMSIPKVGYNKNMIQGFNNAIGGILPVNAEPGTSVSNALHYWQPTQMTMDVDKSIESTISKTMNYKGINDNVLGASKPENTSAIIAQQRAAGVPLESIKRRFYQYLEDVALIWIDFYVNKYNMARALKDDETGEVIQFRGTDYKDVYLDTSIDVGVSTQWGELTTIEVLNMLFDKDVIDKIQFLKRYPKNIIPDQDKLIEELQPGAIMEQIMSMPPEEQQMIHDQLMQMLIMQQQQMAPQQLMTGGNAIGV